MWMLLPDLQILRPSSAFPTYHLGVGDLVVKFKALKLKNIIVRMTTQRQIPCWYSLDSIPAKNKRAVYEATHIPLLYFPVVKVL